MEMPGQSPAGPYGPIRYGSSISSVPVGHPPGTVAPAFRSADTERVGDVERSAVCDALSAHFAAGRLSADDLEHRLTMAVQAVTREDLHRLTVDLPAPAQPLAPAPRQATPQRSWPALSVLAVLALIGSLTIAGGMLLVLGAVEPFLFIAACFGGTAAAVGGASASYLIMQHLRWRRRDE